MKIENKSHTLSLVATPIGNMGDITYRAVETLKDCDYIICEDTRTTNNLLNHYEINNKKLLAFHSNSNEREINKIISLLLEGNHLCYVSDAGTPTISDPGVLLVNKIQEYNLNTENISLQNNNSNEKIKLESIPGPAACITAYSLSGATGNNFIFYGFMPHKKGRETMIKNIIKNDITSIVYESVHRIKKLLESFEKFEKELLENKDIKNKKIYVVCRELTKIFEEVISGDIQEIINYFKNNQDKVRGEFVVVVKN